MSSIVVTEMGEERVVDSQEGVFECLCGSQLFFLTEDGTVECSRCHDVKTSIRWMRARLQ